MNTELTVSYKAVVKHFGSQTLTAAALGIKQPSVNAWVKGKRKMSFQVALKVESETKGKFKAVDLCPSLKEFQDLIA